MANTLPTTMEYFDNLLGEQLTEGGGGGEIETAQVIFRSSSGTYRVASCGIETNNLIIGKISEVATNQSFMVKIPLIDGKAHISAEGFLDVDFTEMPIFSGGITMGEDGIVITGDGSITLKGTV